MKPEKNWNMNSITSPGTSNAPVPWHSAVKHLAAGHPVIPKLPQNGRISQQGTLRSPSGPGTYSRVVYQPVGEVGSPGSSQSTFPSRYSNTRGYSNPMSLVQSSPMAMTAFKAPEVPDINLEGGTLLDVDEHEEIDTDGWRQQVFTYRILSADGTTEITKTIRRKLKLDCTSLVRRMQVTNGVEAAVEEKCERIQGDIRGLRPVEMMSNNQQFILDPNNKQDMQIYNSLSQVSETFMNMLSKEQESIVKMFPELFSQMRTQSQLIPSSNTDIIQNPDGSTTMKTRSSKSFSQSFSSQETYINGVKQENMSKARYRAFVEYKGPDYGFRVKLSDSSTEDLSEDEDDRRSVAHSEFTDNESEVVHPGAPVAKPEAKKRMEKAWFAAKELVDSEQRYVDKLRLLAENFRQRIIDEKVLDRDRQNKLFSNVNSLYQFHNTHFLPQLMEANREWQSTKRIANVVRKQAPFLKMYSEYTNNYDRATKLFEEAKKKKKFADIVSEIEKSPDCDGLPLGHHLICPVQRVMRYQLLLQEYKKQLTDQDPDYEDTAAALELVIQAASHANEMMKKLEGFGKVIEVQEELGNSVSLVSPGRQLLRKSGIQKISSTTDKTEDRFLFLFNDLILLASERRIGLAKYKLRAMFNPCYTQVCEGDDLERENSFYLRGSYDNGPQRCVALLCKSQTEKREWMDALCGVIDDCRANSATFSGSQRSSLCETPSESRNCPDCDAEFSFLSRGVKCGKCKRKFCKKCFGRYKFECKPNRTCEHCVKNIGTDGLPRSQSTFTNGKQENLLKKPSSGDGVIHAGYVKFRGSLNKTFERYFVVRNDFCLYSYLDPKDDSALVMLPLPGTEVRMSGEPFTFTLRSGTRKTYTVTVDSQDSQTHWMALLDLAANAQIQ